MPIIASAQAFVSIFRLGTVVTALYLRDKLSKNTLRELSPVLLLVNELLNKVRDNRSLLMLSAIDIYAFIGNWIPDFLKV